MDLVVDIDKKTSSTL